MMSIFNFREKTELIVGILLLSISLSASVVSENLKSPDSKISITVFEEGKQLFYEVSKENVPQLNKSRLGVVFDKQNFSENMTIKGKDVKHIDESYGMLTGKRRLNANMCNELTLQVENKQGSVIDVVFRAYNDGVAFRYALRDTTLELIAEKELSEFNLPIQSVAWMQRYSWWSPAYETEFENKIRTGTVSPQHREDGWSFPALFNFDNSWILITESNLDKNYCASHIRNKEDSPVYKIEYAIKEQGYKNGVIYPKISGKWYSPWRVAIIGSLHDVVESNLVFHVADNSKVADVSWIKPGRSSWSWLYEPTSPKDFNLLKKSVDIAANLGWEYCLVDANWNLMKKGNIQKLIKYANSKNVGLALWYNSGGLHNQVTEQPRDIMSNPQKRKEEFAKLQKWGVKGVKIDFFESDKQDIIQLYIDILEDAAKYQIMVNFHGCTLPGGWQKTYPHLMTMEAVKGAEFFLLDRNFPYLAGRHNAILPFTRNVVGSMDYTPVNFSHNLIPHITTHSHELALSLVFESGVFHFGDKAESYSVLPQQVKYFLRNVPTVWAETKFLGGYPGKSFVVARRKGDKWYVGGINGNYDATDITVDLSFLGKEKYSAKIIKGSSTSQAFNFDEVKYPEAKKIVIPLLGEDGFVIEIKQLIN